MADEADVVVVGAGFSGLAAARAVHAAGARVTVLEGADHVGGRARGQMVGSAAANLGGEWVGSRHRRMRGLIGEAGLHLEPTRFIGDRIRWRTSRVDSTSRVPPLSPQSSLAVARAFWRAGRLARPLSPEAPWRSANAARLDALSFGRWLEAHGVRGDAYELLDSFVGDLVSAPISRLSLLHVLWWVRRNGGPITAARSAFDARLVEGSDALARWMAAPLDGRLRLGATVTAVEQTGDHVRLHVDGDEELTARRAILALPAPRLADVSFDPPLPERALRVVRELRIGAATKVVARAPGASAGLPRVVVGGPRLTACWRYGDQLTGFARPPHDLVPDDVLARDLAEAYATPAGELRDVTICRWADVPRIGGCDVCFEPGQLCELGPLLGAHHSSIRFAGPERSSWPNNMEGALESGAHAAAATLRSLAERLPIRPQT